MFGVRLDADAESEIVSLLKPELFHGLSADGRLVQIDAVLCDEQRFDHAVLCGVIRPPCRVEPAPPAAEIAGRYPGSDLRPVDPEGDIAFPVIFIVRRLAADLHTQFDRINLFVVQHIIGDAVFEVSLTQPNDLCGKALRGKERARQIVRNDDVVDVCHAAACFRMGVRKTADGDLHGEGLVSRLVVVDIEVEREVIDLPGDEFCVAARVPFAGHRNEACVAEDVDVEGDCHIFLWILLCAATWIFHIANINA